MVGSLCKHKLVYASEVPHGEIDGNDDEGEHDYYLVIPCRAGKGPMNDPWCGLGTFVRKPGYRKAVPNPPDPEGQK